MDSDQQTIKSIGSQQSEIVEGTSQIGTFFMDYGYLTLSFDNSSVFSLDGNGDKTMTLGLIMDAAFTNIITITFYGKTLEN
jgi:hypothetical protein